MRTAKWLLLIFGLLAAGVVLAGAGILAAIWHALNGVRVK